jgi:hypothetical protein
MGFSDFALMSMLMVFVVNMCVVMLQLGMDMLMLVAFGQV